MNKTLCGLLLLCLTLPARAQTTLNLKDADINTLITTVSEVTGKNFIVDDKVKGKVTVISSKPMSTAGVYQTFLAVLAVKGFAVVQAGEVYKIVLDNNAKTEGGARLSEGGKPEDDVITHVYAIENVSAAQLVPILRPLVPQWGHLAAYTPSNMLIISDRASNVSRLQKLIEQIDRTGDREIEMVKLQNAGAADIVRILTTLTAQDKQADPTVKPAVVIADERSNSVLIGGDKSERQKLLDIVSRLDVPLTEDGATQVVYLRHASAENLAPILEGYAQQADGGGKTAAPAAGGVQGTRILADKDTNALVITANPKSMRAIRNVIAQLDIKRSQVLVEAIVAEVSASKSQQLGVDWAVYNQDRIAAAGILNPSTLSGAATAVTTGNPAALVGSGINIVGGREGGANGTSFAVLLKALQTDGDTNILSTPSVVATDNEESELSVGREIPFLTGSFSNTGTGSGQINPFQTIQRKDVGLTLKITPQISGPGDSVKLKINLESSSPESSGLGAVDLVTSKRTLNTTVSVDSGQVLVLGGLMDDNVQDSESGVPILSSIPFIGSLFQYRSIRKEKRNLMVFIRPAILRNTEQADYYTRKKYDSMRQVQIDQRESSKTTILPLGTAPQLPEYRSVDPQAPRYTPPAPAAPAEATPVPVTPAEAAPATQE